MTTTTTNLIGKGAQLETECDRAEHDSDGACSLLDDEGFGYLAADMRAWLANGE